MTLWVTFLALIKRPSPGRKSECPQRGETREARETRQAFLDFPGFETWLVAPCEFALKHSQHTLGFPVVLVAFEMYAIRFRCDEHQTDNVNLLSQATKAGATRTQERTRAEDLRSK